jgi:hypothetical protein
MTPLLSHATPAQGVILLLAVASLLRGSPFPCFRIFLTFYLHHATLAWWIIFLLATVNFLLHVFNSPQMVSFQAAFEMEKQKEIRRGQIWAVGRLGQHCRGLFRQKLSH